MLEPTCRVIRNPKPFAGKQGLNYLEGISAQSVGSKGLCMNMVTIPPGARAKAHLHEAHETVIYVISGRAAMWFDRQLQEHAEVAAGDMIYIPAGVPHLPYNPFDEPCVCVLARTDPNEQESVVLLPELEGLRSCAARAPAGRPADAL